MERGAGRNTLFNFPGANGSLGHGRAHGGHGHGLRGIVGGRGAEAYPPSVSVNILLSRCDKKKVKLLAYL
jgi:hypothetical protein